MSLGLLDVLGPGLMVGDGIHAQSDDLGVALVELWLQTGHVSKLGGADGSEILRMREQDNPLVSDPLVESDLALGGFGSEIRCFVTYANRHIRPPLRM